MRSLKGPQVLWCWRWRIGSEAGREVAKLVKPGPPLREAAGLGAWGLIWGGMAGFELGGSWFGVTRGPHLLPLGLSFTTSRRHRGVSETTRCSSFRSTQTSATGTNTSTGVQSYLEYCGNSPASGVSTAWGGWCLGLWVRRGTTEREPQKAWERSPPLCLIFAVSWMLWRGCLQSSCFCCWHLPLLDG